MELRRERLCRPQEPAGGFPQPSTTSFPQKKQFLTIPRGSRAPVIPVAPRRCLRVCRQVVNDHKNLPKLTSRSKGLRCCSSLSPGIAVSSGRGEEEKSSCLLWPGPLVPVSTSVKKKTPQHQARAEIPLVADSRGCLVALAPTRFAPKIFTL